MNTDTNIENTSYRKRTKYLAKYLDTTLIINEIAIEPNVYRIVVDKLLRLTIYCSYDCAKLDYILYDNIQDEKHRAIILATLPDCFIEKIKTIFNFVFQRFQNVDRIICRDNYNYYNDVLIKFMPNMYFDVFINSSPWFVRQLSADYAKCYDKPNLENNLNEYIGETKLPEGYDIVDSSTIRNFFNKIINQQNSDMNLIYDNIKPWIGEYMASYIFRNNVLEYRFIVYRDYYKPLIYTLLSEDNIDICNTKMISVTNLLITMNYPEYEEITLT